MACALGHNACRQGYKVYYNRLKALMDLCYQGHADGLRIPTQTDH
nr:ATP-binding protein [Enterobacter roggenkampii]